ncbi:MAG: divergent PAP2 family protein [bacterium]
MLRNYIVIILPLFASLVAQTSKMFIRTNHSKLSLKNIAAYSGMPSGHTALMTALTTIIGLTEGIESPIFALTFVMMILVIRDALGIRRYLGEHGKILNMLVKDLDNDKVLEKHYPHLLERVGHTPLQVLVGGTIGIVISLLGYYLI